MAKLYFARKKVDGKVTTYLIKKNADDKYGGFLGRIVYKREHSKKKFERFFGNEILYDTKGIYGTFVREYKQKPKFTKLK